MSAARVIVGTSSGNYACTVILLHECMAIVCREHIINGMWCSLCSVNASAYVEAPGLWLRLPDVEIFSGRSINSTVTTVPFDIAMPSVHYYHRSCYHRNLAELPAISLCPGLVGARPHWAMVFEIIVTPPPPRPSGSRCCTPFDAVSFT